jgi:hypothetical protein
LDFQSHLAATVFIGAQHDQKAAAIRQNTISQHGSSITLHPSTWLHSTQYEAAASAWPPIQGACDSLGWHAYFQTHVYPAGECLKAQSSAIICSIGSLDLIIRLANKPVPTESKFLSLLHANGAVSSYLALCITGFTISLFDFSRTSFRTTANFHFILLLARTPGSFRAGSTAPNSIPAIQHTATAPILAPHPLT